MAIITTMILVMLLLFIVLAMFSLFHVHPAISFHIVRTTSVALNVYVRRCRLVVTDAETHIGSAYLHGNRGIGLIQAEKMETAVSVNMEIIIFVRIIAPLFN